MAVSLYTSALIFPASSNSCSWKISLALTQHEVLMPLYFLKNQQFCAINLFWFLVINHSLQKYLKMCLLCASVHCFLFCFNLSVRNKGHHFSDYLQSAFTSQFTWYHSNISTSIIRGKKLCILLNPAPNNIWIVCLSSVFKTVSNLL